MDKIGYAEELFFNHYRYNKGTDLAPFFDNQKRLFKNIGPQWRTIFMPSRVNVLTLRLLLAQDALREMKDYELAIKQKPGKYENTIFPYHLSGIAGPSLRRVESIGENINPPTVQIHKHSYAFFSHMVSILDRLSHEINEVYQLGIKINVIDWRSIDMGFGILANANPELKNYISNNLLKNNPDIKLLFDYRDTIEHRGTVMIEEFLGRKVEITNDYSIKIQDDPRDQQSTITRPLIKYANESFHLVVKICDEVYAKMIPTERGQ